jgi:hypothetical protein
MLMPLIVPPVSVALDEEKLLAVSAPANEDVPEAVRAATAVAPEVTVRALNDPAAFVVAPMAMPSTDPPVSVALEEEKELDVSAPENADVPDAVNAPTVI